MAPTAACITTPRTPRSRVGRSPLFKFTFNFLICAKRTSYMIEKLQIYKDTYLLTSKLYAAFPQMERSQRHILGAKMLDCAIDLFKWITLANKAREKTERLKYLDEFLTQFELLRVYLRICSDNKLLKLNTLTDLHILISNISRQLSGWKYATTRM